MKIGIIVHSHTGNTYSVVERLREKLKASGHVVNVERLVLVGGEPTNIKDMAKIRLETLPDLSKYDALVFAGPVRGASISPVLSFYLAQISSLKSKKVACLVTEAFPYPWMGGNQTIAKMKKICESKDGVVCGTGIVNWMGRNREKKIENVVEDLNNLF